MTKKDILSLDVNSENIKAVRKGAGNSMPNGTYECIIIEKGEDYDVTYPGSNDKVGSLIVGAWAPGAAEDAEVGRYRVAYDKFLRACGYDDTTEVKTITDDIDNKTIFSIRCEVIEPTQMQRTMAAMKGLNPGDDGYPRTVRRFHKA